MKINNFTLSLFLTIFLIHFSAFSKEYSEKIDSVIQLINKSKNDSQKVNLYNTLAVDLMRINPDSTKHFLSKAYSLTEAINYKEGYAKTYFNLALLYRLSGEYSTAQDFVFKSMSLYESLKNEKGKASCLDNLGVIYMEQGFYSKALDLFIRALHIHEKNNDKLNIAYTYGNIGIVYKLQGYIDQAFIYFSKSLSLNEKLGEKRGISKANNLLGSIYRMKGHYNEAIVCFRKSYHQSKSSSDKFGMAYSMEYIAEAFHSQKKYDQAIHYNKEALKIRESLGHITGIAKNLFNIGESYLAERNFTEAEAYFIKSLELSEKCNLKGLIMESFGKLAELYYQKSDYRKSSDFFKKWKMVNDTVSNMQNAKKITQLEMNLEFEKKQHNLELKEKQKELQHIQETSRQKIYRNIFIFGFVLAALLVIVFIRFYKIQSRNNRLLVLKNQEIEQKNEEIVAQRDQLENSNKELEKLSIVASETDNAVIIADDQGIIEWVNGGFVRLYGYKLHEFIELRGANIIKASSYEDIVDAIFHCMCNKKSYVYSTQTNNSAGDKIWVQTTLTPIINDKGKVVKLVAIDSDITKIKEAENEIRAQKEELHSQREVLSQVNLELEKKNVQILDSIEYAKHIQDAILITEPELSEIVNESFIFFKPRDIVSGDFYWITKQENKIYSAVIDCTGHGVSGAFMSMLGYAFLSEIVNKEKGISAGKILQKLRENIILTLGQANNKGSHKYGMDMSLCIIDKEKMTMQYSGANCPVYLLKRNIATENKEFELVEIKATKLSIGASRKGINEFEDKTYDVSHGDLLYLFSDGFSDQFGGNEGWKYMASNFKKLILNISSSDMKKQKQMLANEFNSWMNGHNQTDDVTIVGLKI